MRYYEFALNEAEDTNPIVSRLAAIIGQLIARTKDTGAKKPMSIDALLDILADQDIELSRNDLESMMDEPPLSNLIANLEGDDVIFVDQDRENQGDAIDADQSSATLDQMAQRAASKPNKL